MMKLALALLLATAAPLPALAQDKPDAAAAARDQTLLQAIQAINAKQPQKGLDLVEPLLADYERSRAGDKRMLLCDVEPYETAAYATLPGGKDARLVEGNWCIALWAKGFALIDLQQLDAAVPYLERAVAMAPFHPHYLSELGYGYQAQKRFQLSYDTYVRAAEAAQRESGDRRAKSLRRAWFGMGFDLIEMGKLDQAEALFRKCLELDPNDEGVKNELRYIEQQRAKAKTS
jgi:tetratricopeptide (TPR) repeat protein